MTKKEMIQALLDGKMLVDDFAKLYYDVRSEDLTELISDLEIQKEAIKGDNK